MRRRIRIPVALAIAALLGGLALVLPDRCIANEIGHHRANRTGDLSLGPAPRAEQDARFTAACGLPRLTGTEEGGPIDRAPYLQQVTSSSAMVVWTGDSLRDPAVVVRRPPDADHAPVPGAIDPSAGLPVRVIQYVALLDDLVPGAIHCYEVRDGDRLLAGPFGFSTAQTGAPIRLVAFGDMGYRTSDQRGVLDQMSRVEFDLALLSGDLAYPDGTLDQLDDNFFAVYARLMRSAPFVPASGNHDYRTDDAAPFRAAFLLPENGGQGGRERWYSADWGDLHLVVLDTEKVGHEQALWLENDLSANRLPWVIAVLHRTPFSSGEHGPDMAVRREFMPILIRHRVPLVIAGHEHHYERFVPIDGTTVVVTGGGGRGTRRVAPGPTTAFGLQVAHFVYLVIRGDELRLWAIDATGQTFDTVRLLRGRSGRG